MKFFYSPVELFSLITNSKKYSVADKVQAKWFFSKKGEQAYKEADVSKKTRLFYDYLSINRKENEQSNQLTLKMSYLLASGIAGSSLEYGSYPQIFDKEKNPFIKYFCDNNRFNTNELLAILNNESDSKKFANYKSLTYQSEDYPKDIYKIERLIITLGKKNQDSVLETPFTYTNNMFGGAKK